MQEIIISSTSDVLSNFSASRCQLLGNFIPSTLYKQITKKGRGGPDLTSISILSEIIYWYRPRIVTDEATGIKKHARKFLGDAWQTSYIHFEKKFNFNHETIRRSLVKLEQLGFIKREFRTVLLRGQKYSNALFIHLNLDKCMLFIKVPSHNDSKKFIDTNSFAKNLSNADFFKPVCDAPSPQIVGDNNIDIKNKKNKNRSIRSNSFKRNFETLENTIDTSNQLVSKTLTTRVDNKGKYYYQTGSYKTLKDFYPLDTEDAGILIKNSARDFSSSFINKLLLRLSEKYPEHRFFSKKSFLSYMAKALCNEIRQATLVNNENFSFKDNSKTNKRDKYLEEVEYSKDISKEAQLRRKIAAVFDSETAYKLLLNVRLKINAEGNKKVLVAFLPNDVELTKLQCAVLLEQGRAVYSNIDELRLCHGVNYTMAVKKGLACELHVVRPDQQQTEQEAVWEKMRFKLKNYYGTDIDKSWFSKLIAEENKEQRTLKLQAPTAFIRDWIQQHYRSTIERFCNHDQYELDEIALA